jgi:hypothetical protein
MSKVKYRVREYNPTSARCARRWGRHYVGFELNPEYIDIIRKKSNVEVDMFAQ